MTGSIEEWPQVGDDALVAAPSGGLGGDGKRATLKRAKVTKIGVRDVVLDVGVRFRLADVSAGMVTIRRRGDTWGHHTSYVLHPDHERAASYRMHNELCRLTSEVWRLADAIEQQARVDHYGSKVSDVTAEDLVRAVKALVRRRVSYGLETAASVAAGGPEDQDEHGEDEDEPQHRVDGEAEHDGDGDQQQGEQRVD